MALVLCLSAGAVAMGNPQEHFNQGQVAFDQYNYPLAADFWKKGVHVGHQKSLARLGECYYLGHGVPQDINKGLGLLKKAASQGSIYAQKTLYLIDPTKFTSYKGAYLEVSPRRKFLEPVEPSGLTYWKMYEIGVSYYYGNENKPQDYQKALELFTQTANQGLPEAQWRLGSMYAKGQGVPQNAKQAEAWFQKAAQSFLALAEKGDRDAQYMLGLRYEMGEGVGMDMDQATYWYRKAESQGQQDARKRLVELGVLP